MLWKLATILIVAIFSVMNLSSYAQSMNTYSVANPQGGQSYIVNYNVTSATINEMRINLHDTSLVILMNSTADGNLVIDLPRTLIDAKTGTVDDQFIVLVDDTYTSFHETKTQTDRTLTIPVSAGSSRIEIIGTQVVPEFGPLPAAILAVSLISIIAISKRTKLRFLHPGS